MDLICRTCLAYDDQLEPLFSKKLVDTDYNEITTMIFLCTGLEISEDDNLSNTICTQCIESIIAAFKYRKKVLHSNTVLHETMKLMMDVEEEDVAKFEDEDNYEPFIDELIEVNKPLSEHAKDEPNSYEDSHCTNNINLLITATPDNQNHLTDAHQPSLINHVCDFCGKGFKFESVMRQHINRHKGIKPFKCEICEFRTVASYELKVHLRTHTGEKPYVCHICGMAFNSSSHRGAHIKEVHSNGQQYECLICGKTYESRRAYMSHKLLHIPNRQIKCDVCSKEFNYRKNLKRHMRQHGEKKFKCTMCEKDFYEKQNWQTHMKNDHNINM